MMIDQVREQNDDKKIAFIGAFFWGYHGIMPYVVQAIELVVSNNLIATSFAYITIFLIIIFALRPVIWRLSRLDMLFLMFVCIVILVSMFFSDNTGYIIGLLPRFLCAVLPLYFIGRAITNYQLIMKYLKVVSVIVLLVNISYYLYYLASGRMFCSDNMDLAYNLLPSVLVLLLLAFEKGRVLWWIAGVGGILFVFMQGARGPFICILVFLVLYLVANFKLRTVVRYIPFFIIGGFFGSEKFLIWIPKLGRFLDNHNISSRIIQMFLQNEFSSDNGRADLFHSVINGIMQHPLGNGIMGDRVLTNGSYVHNLFLEVFCQFGVVIGSMLLITLFLLTYKALREAPEVDKRNFIVMLIILGVVKLMLSSSYLIEPYFFLLVGVIVGSTPKKQPYYETA